MANDPRIEELSDSDDAPDLENVAGESKQSRGERKARKAVSKLGLKPVKGITRVTMKKNKNILFVVSKPDVLKSPTCDTFIVFGETKMEDLSAQARAQAQAYSQMAAQQQAQAAVQADAAAPAVADTAETSSGSAAEVNVDETDVELVMQQGGVDREKALKALAANKGDMLEAIFSLQQ